MTIPEPTIPELTSHLDLIVTVPPNDNTDGDNCACGHAKAAHHPTEYRDPDSASWQCRYCGCTRGYPAVVPMTG